MHNKAHTLRKAAILVASLDHRTADALLDQMSEQQAATVRRLMMDLGDIDPEEQEDVIDEFFRIGPFNADLSGEGIELDPSLARQIDRAAHVENTYTAPARPIEPFSPAIPPFRLLQQTSCDKLMPFLEREHPQTVALVISHLPADRAAELLACLAPALQAEVMRRLVELDQANPEVLREIERGLQSWFAEQDQLDQRRAAGLSALQSILAAADPRGKRELLANLATHDRPLSSRLTREQFEFSDIESLDDATILLILQAAEPEVAVLSLAGSSERFVQRIASQLPARDARMLRKKLDNMGPTRLSDLEDARHELARLARQLEVQGRIDLSRTTRLATAN
jgi:flagellar motor switch protein FliG